MLKGCALLAPVSSSCLQLATEVCLIPSISVKNGPVLPLNRCLKRRGWLDAMVEDSGGKPATETSRRGCYYLKWNWMVQHTVKIDSRFQSREYTRQIVNMKKETKKKRQTSSPSFTTYTPQPPELLLTIREALTCSTLRPDESSLLHEPTRP